MALKKKPVTGMRDILPAEMQVREYVMNQIRERSEEHTSELQSQR